MVKLFRDSVTVSDLWVSSHERLSDFSTSSWQRGESPVPMLALRLLLATITVAIFVWSLVMSPHPHWLVFLTNWGVLLIVMMTLSGLLVSCVAVCKKVYDRNELLPWYVSMYWFLFNITVSIALMITGLYWILLYNPDPEEPDTVLFWLDIATHGVNSCVVVVEVLMSRVPIRFLHLYQPLGLGLWYAAFSAIYYAAGGTVNGNPFIYEILDWRQAGRAGTLVALSAVALIVVYTIVWGIGLCRDKISTSLIRTTSRDLPSAPPDRHMFDGVA